MNDAEKIDGLRKEYITTMAEIAGLAVDRATHIPGDAGMGTYRSPEDAAESLTTVEKINKRIADACNKLRSVEQRGRGCIGIPAVLGADVPNAIRTAVAILAGKSISGHWTHETHHLGTLLLPAGGNNPQDLLAVREAFRKTGLLRPHVRCELGRTLDELSNLTLAESTFRQLLALEPDSECEDVIRARELVAVLGRR
jgi:hypothetical protein